MLMPTTLQPLNTDAWDSAIALSVLSYRRAKNDHKWSFSIQSKSFCLDITFLGSVLYPKLCYNE